MLVLAREEGQSIRMKNIKTGEEVWIKYLRMSGGRQIRLGLAAGQDWAISRVDEQVKLGDKDRAQGR